MEDPRSAPSRPPRHVALSTLQLHHVHRDDRRAATLVAVLRHASMPAEMSPPREVLPPARLSRLPPLERRGHHHRGKGQGQWRRRRAASGGLLRQLGFVPPGRWLGRRGSGGPIPAFSFYTMCLCIKFLTCSLLQWTYSRGLKCTYSAF
jgi:hypothetical protein